MGVTKPSFQKKKKISITIDKHVWSAIKERSEDIHQTPSSFINNLLKVLVYNDLAFKKFRLKESKLQQAYWQYEIDVAEEAQKDRQQRLGA